ncbi:MAG: hypothetical protein KatS3mg110_3957 [Pirellulaceae bacterium]|nr:MAG: hypothetical protein KatS3mg110_3957 [Pirellulaceae bacterium]
MRLGFLGAADSWYFRDLKRAAVEHELVPLSFSLLQASVGLDQEAAASGSIALGSCEAILVRVMPAGSLEQVVFRMDVLGQYERAGGVLVNPAKTVEVAVDKYLALARLAEAGLPVPATVVCQTAEQAMEAFRRLGGDVVVKPLFGSEGRGLCRVNDEEVAERVFRALDVIRSVHYVQRYIEHGNRDWRLLVIGERVLGMERMHRCDWRTNLSRGAEGRSLVVSSVLEELALRAARAVGASLVGVDVLPDQQGSYYVIEVNASPGWRGIQQVTGVDVARLIVEHLVERAEGAIMR